LTWEEISFVQTFAYVYFILKIQHPVTFTPAQENIVNLHCILHYYIVPGISFKPNFSQFSTFASKLLKPLKVIKYYGGVIKRLANCNQTFLTGLILTQAYAPSNQWQF
jgi:hypothetical protein